MREELDEKLTREHPTLFGDRYGNLRTTAMCWGFECGDGWYDLLKEAADKLEPLCKTELDKVAHLEKSWYRHVRSAISSVATAPAVFKVFYNLAEWLCPTLYSNPLYWYGGPPCRASQVKEKFGTLRFYMTGQTAEMDDIIGEATRKSAVTCEECGKPGRLRGHGWLYTACKRHVRSA